MEEEFNPYAHPTTEYTPDVPELTQGEVLRRLVVVLFLLSAGGIGLLGLVTEKAEAGVTLVIGTVYGMAAVICGFIPMAFHANLYFSRLSTGAVGYGRSLVIALISIFLPVFIIWAMSRFTLSGLLQATGFCYLHAAPTALVTHFLIQRRLQRDADSRARLALHGKAE